MFSFSLFFGALGVLGVAAIERLPVLRGLEALIGLGNAPFGLPAYETPLKRVSWTGDRYASESSGAFSGSGKYS